MAFKMLLMALKNEAARRERLPLLLLYTKYFVFLAIYNNENIGDQMNRQIASFPASTVYCVTFGF